MPMPTAAPGVSDAAAHAHPVAEPVAETDLVTKIEKLAELKAQGILSEDEFSAAKRALIGSL